MALLTAAAGLGAKALTSAKGLSLGQALTGLFVGQGLLNFGKDVAGQQQQYGLGQKQLSLQEQLMAGQLEGAKASNEANRQAAAEYVQLLKEEKSESRKQKSADRRMRLMMMMIAGMGNVNQAANQAQFAQDMSPVGLMRGAR